VRACPSNAVAKTGSTALERLYLLSFREPKLIAQMRYGISYRVHLPIASDPQEGQHECLEIWNSHQSTY
jgi:hypothetical protein